MKNRCSECQRALHEDRLAALPQTKTCSRRCDVSRAERMDREIGEISEEKKMIQGREIKN